jgi:hypothetical protein
MFAYSSINLMSYDWRHVDKENAEVKISTRFGLIILYPQDVNQWDYTSNDKKEKLISFIPLSAIYKFKNN